MKIYYNLKVDTKVTPAPGNVRNAMGIFGVSHPTRALAETAASALSKVTGVKRVVIAEITAENVGTAVEGKVSWRG